MNHINKITVLTSACLLVTILVSYAFWTADRLFPLVPVIEGMVLEGQMDQFLLLLVMGLLTGLAVHPKRLLAGLSFAGLAVLIFLDQNRLQPYIFMYASTLMIIAFGKEKHKDISLDSLRIMVAFAYFWSGIHKINIYFYSRVFPWFIQNHLPSLPDSEIVYAALVGFVLAVPVLEALVGVLFLTLKNKKIPLVMAGMMLVVVILSLGPLGHEYNIIVWPWNVWLFVMAVWLFKDETRTFKDIFSFKPEVRYGMKAIVMALFCILPLLGFWHKWDAYLSFKLYSGSKHVALVSVDPQEAVTLPPFLRNKLRTDYTVSFDAVNLGLYNVASYPARRVFLKVWGSWCHEYNLKKSNMIITLEPPDVRKPNEEVYNCEGERVQ